MHTEQPWLVKCPHCKKPLWIDELEEVGRLDFPDSLMSWNFKLRKKFAGARNHATPTAELAAALRKREKFAGARDYITPTADYYFARLTDNTLLANMVDKTLLAELQADMALLADKTLSKERRELLSDKCYTPEKNNISAFWRRCDTFAFGHGGMVMTNGACPEDKFPCPHLKLQTFGS